ncbi:MAG: hypothetical protein E7082_07255 [Bacteroidales bacterium]|nr:hypothetical protein [Bacteroidales bacterium]
MNFANFIPAILGILGLKSFREEDGKKSLSPEERATLKGYGFSDRFLDDFAAALNSESPEDEPSKDKQYAAIQAILGKVTSQLSAKTEELEVLKSKSTADAQTHAAEIQAKEAEITSLKEKIKALSDLPETDPGKGAGQSGSAHVSFNLDDTEQLGGLSGEFFSLDRPYNMRAKAALLAAQGQSLVVAVANRVDYKRLQDDLGAFYRLPWRDRLQSFLRELPTIEKIFSLESGHQDLDTLVNIWLGEFSQADNTQDSDFDNVTKGSYEFDHETLRMYDVMFAYRFKNLKAIEKSWIGYLNKEGSNAVKLSFIEYLLAETAKKLHNEREQRRINGVRKNPDPNVPGRAMEASDGLYEYLRKKVEGHTDFTPNGGTSGKTVYQIKPFNLPKITPANIGEVFYTGTSMIPSVFRDTGTIVLYIPSFMLPWYHKYNEAHYGRNVDYQKNITYVKEFPGVRIETIPNADNHHRIFWTIEGNFHTYEHIAGEMLRFNLEQEDWSLKAWSEWKEGLAAEAVGYKYTDRNDMDGSRQLVWCNDYDLPESFYLEADPDTNPSVLLHSSIVTVANKSLLTITDIENAAVGQVISIKCGADGDSGVKINNTGNFSLLSDPWTPAKGEIIRVMKRADGKFIEIERITTSSDAYEFPADAATPSVQGATVFVTNANTKATAITDLTDAVAGTVYTIHGAGSTFASTIANAGNFALTAAITLKSGTFIKLVKASDGKFYEVERG